MKKKNSILRSAFGSFLALCLLAGCGAAEKSTAAATVAYDSDEAAVEEIEWESAEAAEVEEAVGAAEMPETGFSAEENRSSMEQKLIKTVGISMQTREFETLLEDVQKQTAQLGGYVENSDVSGNSYYHPDGMRDASLTLRIPVEQLKDFLAAAEGLGNVTNKWERVEDVTLQYVDVESHKKALQTEQERLLALLEKADTMEDIIAIESRLSEVRYELQSYESTLRTYDNQIHYSTVHLDIQEVERMSSTAEKQSFFGEVKERLLDNLYHIGKDLREGAIWCISSLPYLVILAAILTVLLLVVRKIRKKKRAKRERKEELQKEELQK